CHNDYSYPYTF
nr:immunoglobulin light chain junction region [Mus musculus]